MKLKYPHLSVWKNQLLEPYHKLGSILDGCRGELSDTDKQAILAMATIIPMAFVRSQIIDPEVAMFVNNSWYPLGLAGDDELDYREFPDHHLPITSSIAEIYDFKIYNDRTQPWDRKQNLERMVEVLGLLISNGLSPWGPSERLVKLLLDVDDDHLLIEWGCFDRREHRHLLKIVERKYARDFKNRHPLKKSQLRRCPMPT